MKKTVFFVTMVLLFHVVSAHGGCVDTFGIGSRATALGGAYTATADDPYAVYYNPAGLSRIQGSVVSLGVHMIDPSIELKDYVIKNSHDPEINVPAQISDDSPSLFAPHLGYARNINSKLSFGVAAYVPWGLELEWDDDPARNPAAYNYFHSYYWRIGITPAVSYKINDKLAIGIGITLGKSECGAEKRFYLTNDIAGDIPAYYNQVETVYQGASLIKGSQVSSTAEAAQLYSGAASMVPGGETREQYTQAAMLMEGLSRSGVINPQDLNGMAALDHGAEMEMELEDSFNYSYNIGIMYMPLDTLTLGLAYRSKTDADFEGDVIFKGEKIGEARLDYDHPAQVQVGVRYQPHEKFFIEGDLVWTDWNSNSYQMETMDNDVTITLAPGLTFAENTITTHRDWVNTKQVRIGMEYILNDMVTIRGGYFYDPTPIPEDTLDLQWPDADKKIYSIGLGVNFGTYTVDTVLQYATIEKDRIVGGESENLNYSYNPSLYPDSEVATRISGHMYGLGVTVSYHF